MADEESRSGGNIFEILQTKAPIAPQFEKCKELTVAVDGHDAPNAPVGIKQVHRNTPELQFSVQQKMEVDQNLDSSAPCAGVSNVVTSRDLTSSPEPKRPRLVIPTPNAQNGNSSEACHSPDSGKRRRIQHDYRRLSSSGYVDDYEKGKDSKSKFALVSESETSPVSSKSRSNDSSPKRIRLQSSGKLSSFVWVPYYNYCTKHKLN